MTVIYNVIVSSLFFNYIFFPNDFEHLIKTNFYIPYHIVVHGKKKICYFIYLIYFS